jgi:peptidoglycan/xylan/chitin deacetylase (PgdA/CDA1 family)
MSTRSLTEAIRGGAAFLDRRVARLGLRLERPALLSFLFHGVFENGDEIDARMMHPQERLTVADFRTILEHFREAGYRFVSIAEIEAGLPEADHCACITFDDGYANNLRLLPLLREYRAPAAIFVTTKNVLRGTRFWWDTVYAERARRGAPANAIDREIDWVETTMHPSEIEAYVVQTFGVSAATPRSDVDRPLTPEEVGVLAQDELITIGNHTVDHAILNRLPPDEAREQIRGAQASLQELTGRPVGAIAYPNGDYDRASLEAARELGITCGVTTVRRKEHLPVSPERLLQLGRFLLEPGRDLNEQLRVARSGIQLGNAARRVRDRRARARA